MRGRIRAWYRGSYARRVARSFTQRGVWKTLRLVKEERWLQVRYGIRVSGVISPEDLTIESENRARGHGYEAVNYSAFRAALGLLDEPFAGFSFIDLGCGKGFALVLASEYGFSKLIGVEFSPVLAEVCRTNLARFYRSRRRKPGPPFEILDLDATKMVLPAGNHVIFLFNPFDEAVVKETFRNLKGAVETGNSRVYVVYVNALHKEVLAELGFTLVGYRETDPLRVYRNGIAIFRLGG